MSFNFNTLKKTYRLFTPYIYKNKTSRKRFGFAALLVLIDVAAGSSVPYLSKCIVDSLHSNIASSVFIFVLLLGFFWMIEKTLSHIQDIVFFPIINMAIRDLTFDVVNHIHHIPLSDYQRLSMAEIINCTRRISISARSFIKIFFLLIIPTSIKLLITTIITIKLGLFGLGLLPAIMFAGIILYKGTNWYTAIRESAWQLSDTVVTRVNDSILNTKITRFFYTEETRQISDLLDKEATLWHTHNTRQHCIHIMIGLVLGLTITGIMIYAIQAIQNHVLTVGYFVLLKGQLLAAFLPLKILSVEFRQLAESTVDIKKIIHLFEIPIESDHKVLLSPQTVVKTNNSGIVFQNVSFGHTSSPMIFNDLSFQITRGCKLAIIGDSGSGKSTLIHLMAALQRPTFGTISIFGQNIHALPKQSFYKHVHFIPQDLRLFNMSLRDNIIYGSKQISENILLKVIEQVGLMGFINQTAMGLDTQVGEMGINLSGGEKQKVALARALLIKPEILLLDETTHSLDTDCEKTVLQQLFLQIPTVIIVSHKISTLNYVDRVLKIQAGSLLEIDIGKHLSNYLPNTSLLN